MSLVTCDATAVAHEQSERCEHPRVDLRSFIDAAIKADPVEAKITRRVFRALAASGDPVVKVWDTEEYTKARTEAEVMDIVFNLDLAYLITKSGGYVMLVRGNDWDMVSDYTLDLESALAPVNAWIERHW